MKPKSSKTNPKRPTALARPGGSASVSSVEEMRECIDCLWGVVSDMLPQIGRIVLQDYERLNRGAGLAEKILRQPTPNDGTQRSGGSLTNELTNSVRPPLSLK